MGNIKVWKKVIVIVFLTLVILIAWLWQFNGLKEFTILVTDAYKLQNEQKVNADTIFLKHDDEFSYNGVLAGINTKFIPGIFVWGNKGLKFFRTDEFTVYSDYKMCTDKNIESFSKNVKFAVDRTIFTDVAMWHQNVNNGTYVAVTLAKVNHGGNLGYLREIASNDWVPFIPVDIKKLCEK